MTVWGYARVSTAEQSVGMQVEPWRPPACRPENIVTEEASAPEPTGRTRPG